MHAPLTGVFLIAELTGGYDLFLPLMIVSISSYITILMFEPHSIYSMRLAQKGELLTHHKDRAVLTLLRADSVIEKDFQMVSPEMTLGDMVKVISRSGRNTFLLWTSGACCWVSSCWIISGISCSVRSCIIVSMYRSSWFPPRPRS